MASLTRTSSTRHECPSCSRCRGLVSRGLRESANAEKGVLARHWRRSIRRRRSTAPPNASPHCARWRFDDILVYDSTSSVLVPVAWRRAHARDEHTGVRGVPVRYRLRHCLCSSWGARIRRKREWGASGETHTTHQTRRRETDGATGAARDRSAISRS